MNREIKFRGKLLGINEWIYGSLLNNKFILLIIPDVNEYRFDCENHSNADYEVDPKTVGQYIGIEDNSKKEIYDGDILQHHSGQIFKIIYKIPDCRFFADYVKFNGDYSSIMLQTNEKGLAKIIGNIHDNPELLEINNDN